MESMLFSGDNSVTQHAGTSLVNLTIDPSASTEDFGVALHESDKFWKVPIVDGSDSENESNIPVFFIYSFNERLLLWTSNVENYFSEIQGEMKLWPDLEYPLFDEEIANKEKGIVRHSSVQKCG